MHEKVIGALEKGGHPYTVHRHADLSVPIRGPKDFANALGYDLSRITKSLFLKSRDGERYIMAVCSMTRKLDLPLIAEHLGIKKITMAGADELASQVGFPSTGVSPIGVDPIPVLMDNELCRLPTILVGAGAVGVEVEINPIHLYEITGATLGPFAK